MILLDSLLKVRKVFFFSRFLLFLLGRNRFFDHFFLFRNCGNSICQLGISVKVFSYILSLSLKAGISINTFVSLLMALFFSRKMGNI